MKYYVVADVHGFFSELDKALTNAGFFSDKLPNKLIICGDLLDRGSQPNELCSFLERLLAEDRLILIRGNHEDLMLDLMDRIDYYNYFGIDRTHHYHNGTVSTLLKMTYSEGFDLAFRPERVINKMKNTTFYKKLLPACQDYFETDNYIFVHGYIPCYFEGRPNSAKNLRYNPNWRNASKEEWENARWINGMVACAEGVKEEGKTIVFGHYRSSFGHAVFEGKVNPDGSDDNSPYYADGIIALDSNTARSGEINCVVIED